MKELKERIIKGIKNKAKMRGLLSTNTVRITLILTDKEIKKLVQMDINEKYSWELEGNKLYVSYVEEIDENNGIIQNIPANQIKFKDTLIWNNGKTCEVTKIETEKSGNKIITYKYYDDGSKEYEENSEEIDSERLVKIRRNLK